MNFKKNYIFSEKSIILQIKKQIKHTLIDLQYGTLKDLA